jgi:hypothetical protein
MLNTNVGDMPLDIFADYISDVLGQEWNLEYLITAINDNGHENGYGWGYCIVFGNGNRWGYGYENGYGSGDGFGNGYGDGRGFGFGNGYNHSGNG